MSCSTFGLYHSNSTQTVIGFMVLCKMLFFPFFILFSSFSSPKHILQPIPKVNFKNTITSCQSSAWLHMEQRLKSILHPLDYWSNMTGLLPTLSPNLYILPLVQITPTKMTSFVILQ